MKKARQHGPVTNPVGMRNSAHVSDASGRTVQLGLAFDGYDAKPYLEATWRRLLELLGEVSAQIGPKEAAWENDVQPSVWAHALAGRDRHEVKAKWLPWFILRDPSDRILELLASLRGYELVSKNAMTPEEELAAIKDAMGQTVGPDVRALILEKAKRTR